MPTAPPSPPTRSTPAETRLTVATFVAFMTASGQAQQILKARMLAADIEQGLGPLHLHALCLCQRSPGATQQQLVQSMGRDKGQMARLIRELEDRQLLVRTPDERDRRVWRLSLTPEGNRKVPGFWPWRPHWPKTCLARWARRRPRLCLQSCRRCKLAWTDGNPMHKPVPAEPHAVSRLRAARLARSSKPFLARGGMKGSAARAAASTRRTAFAHYSPECRRALECA